MEAEPGEPVPGLSSSEARLSAEGRALFNRPFTPEEGLGPLFNQTRCSSCHDLPTSGGHGAEPVRKATRFDASGCSLLRDQGGDLLQTSVTDALRDAGFGPERIPSDATGFTDLRPPPLYGLGLVEAVPEQVLLERADPTDRDGDGISGRAARGADGRLGRFGAKGQHTTLAGFIDEAAHGEMGLTTPTHTLEGAINGVPIPEELDPAPDPEIGAAELQRLTAYVRFLAPPPPDRPSDPAEAATVEAGRRVFEEIGCARCHVPALETGDAESPPLAHKRFRAYSDFLLHDLGPELGDVCGPDAAPSEWITARLVGLRHRHEYLHNNRAQSLHAAIELHGGEGVASRDAYRALPPEVQERLMRFLQSL